MSRPPSAAGGHRVNVEVNIIINKIKYFFYIKIENFAIFSKSDFKNIKYDPF